MAPRASTGRFGRLHRPFLLAALALLTLSTHRAQAGFLAVLGFDAANLPYSVVVGDFDRDGKLDLAVANSGSNTVSVMLGNGDGTFQSPRNFPVGSFPRGLA